MPLKKSTGNMYDWVTHMWSPVRGKCKHECDYCMPSHTKILIKDLTYQNIDSIKKGDQIIGLSNDNKGYNKFIISTVEQISKRKAPTIRITTEDNDIECTLEHPLLGSTQKRGGTDWKKASSFSPYQILRYIGTPNPISFEYESRSRGWLSGFCDGDGCFFTHKNEYGKSYSGFEAVCIDDELKKKIILIAKEKGVVLKEGKKYNSSNSFSKNKYNEMIFSRSSDNVEKLKNIIKFAEDEDYHFYIGYIAGMIDSDGSVGEKGKSIRIAQSKSKNKIKYDRIIFALNKIGFEYAEEKRGIRIKSNFRTRMKILFDGKPSHSIKKNRLILNSSYKGSKRSEIQKISQSGEQTVFNLQTSSENFIANGFIVHNCYMKRFPLPPMSLNEKELNSRLGEDNVIFVCHTADLFADDVPAEWIEQVLWKCREAPKNKYLFQSKNPGRFIEFIDKYPPSIIFGTTIETNRTTYVESKAPTYTDRAEAIGELSDEGYETIVTIEPIYDFDLDELVSILTSAKPTWINIGADSKDNDIPEPSKKQIVELIEALKTKIDIKLKNNLKRILGKEL